MGEWSSGCCKSTPCVVDGRRASFAVDDAAGESGGMEADLAAMMKGEQWEKEGKSEKRNRNDTSTPSRPSLCCYLTRNSHSRRSQGTGSLAEWVVRSRFAPFPVVVQGMSQAIETSLASNHQ